MDVYTVQGEYSRNGYRLLELDRKVPWSTRSRKILIDGKKYSFFRNGIESWLIAKGINFSCIGKNIQLVDE